MVRITTSNEDPQPWLVHYEGFLGTEDGKVAKFYTVQARKDAAFSQKKINEAKEVIDRVLRHDVGDLEIGFAALTPRHLTVAMWERTLTETAYSYILHPHTFPYNPSRNLRLIPDKALHTLPEEMLEIPIFELALLKRYDQVPEKYRDAFLHYLEAGYNSEED